MEGLEDEGFGGTDTHPRIACRIFLNRPIHALSIFGLARLRDIRAQQLLGAGCWFHRNAFGLHPLLLSLVL